MDIPTMRTKTIVEHVISTEGGIDAKQFSFAYDHIWQRMKADGVDMNYDDAFFVKAGDDEIIFYYTKDDD